MTHDLPHHLPPNIGASVVHGHRCTVAKVTVFVSNEIITSHGEAIRHPEDRNDPDVAEHLALGRALQNLGTKLERRGNGMVRHNDHVREHKRKARKFRHAITRRAFSGA